MLTPEEIKLIKNCFLFSESKDEELNRFLESGDCFVCSFSKGENIANGGKNEKKLGIILSGKASSISSCERDTSNSSSF